MQTVSYSMLDDKIAYCSQFHIYVYDVKNGHRLDCTIPYVDTRAADEEYK